MYMSCTYTDKFDDLYLVDQTNPDTNHNPNPKPTQTKYLVYLYAKVTYS